MQGKPLDPHLAQNLVSGAGTKPSARQNAERLGRRLTRLAALQKSNPGANRMHDWGGLKRLLSLNCGDLAQRLPETNLHDLWEPSPKFLFYAYSSSFGIESHSCVPKWTECVLFERRVRLRPDPRT